MEAQSKQVSQLIESGEYFKRSRAWYQSIYIGPIAERTFFLIIAALSGLVALISFIAVLSFLPLTDHPGILVPTERPDETVPQLFRLDEEGVPINESLKKFFVSVYVQAREGYSESSYDASFRFVQAQSDAPTFQKYAAMYERSNKQSPAAILGSTGERAVYVRDIRINDASDPKVATVQFTTEILGRNTSSRTNWTAVLQFYYTDLLVAETPTIHPETGEEILTTQDPQFKVVDYVLTKSY